MASASHPVELRPVDISAYRGGNSGPSHVLTMMADRPGPHVAINALMHGNELSGAIALDFLLRQGIAPRRGRLTFSFANVAAYAAFDPSNPAASRFLDEDMNRVWDAGTLDGSRQSLELARARELRPVFESVDMLLDLHSMQNASDPLMLCGPAPRGAALAERVGIPSWIVADGGHSGGRRLIDHARFTASEGNAVAILAECGQHWRRSTADTAIQVSLRFLLATGTIDPNDAAPWLAPLLDAPLRRVQVTEAVTALGEDFRFVDDFQGLEIVPQAGTVIALDGGKEIVTPHDDCILIMPARHLKPGQTAVRLGRILA